MSIRHLSKKGKTAVGFLLMILLLSSISLRYLLQYSVAAKADVNAVLLAPSGYSVSKVSEYIRILPDSPNGTGILFYPGGKVDEQAYLPLLSKLAQQGLSIVLVKMPFHLAIFNINAATGAMASMPDVHDWYLAGHSLGGSMACIYATKNLSALDGLILLAAYSTSDLSGSALPILTVYGSEDHVLGDGKLEKYRHNLPVSAQTRVIAGGNHAYFGNYGEQQGDGNAAISRETQQDQTIEYIMEFLKSNQ